MSKYEIILNRPLRRLLISKLINKGYINIQDFFRHYADKRNAKGFLNQLIISGVVELNDSNIYIVEHEKRYIISYLCSTNIKQISLEKWK